MKKLGEVITVRMVIEERREDKDGGYYKARVLHPQSMGFCDVAMVRATEEELCSNDDTMKQ